MGAEKNPVTYRKSNDGILRAPSRAQAKNPLRHQRSGLSPGARFCRWLLMPETIPSADWFSS